MEISRDEAPRVRVTGPQGELVPFTLDACQNGVTRVRWRSCESGQHVVAVLDEAGNQQTVLETHILPQPKRIVTENGPAQQVVFEFGGLVPGNNPE